MTQIFATLDDAFVFADSLAENIRETVKNYRTDHDAVEAQKTIIGNLMCAQDFHPYDIDLVAERFTHSAVLRLV